MFREATQAEKRLLGALVARAGGLPLSDHWLVRIRVRYMDDGGMGSLELSDQELPLVDRLFGGRVAEHEFEDADGVAVLASLNLDQFGQLFELDLWKVNFDPLIRIPDHL